MASRTVEVRVADLEVFKSALRRIIDLHTPHDEEAEFWSDNDDDKPEHDRRWPDCPGGYGCEGHTATIKVCSECGYSHDGETPRYRLWPCPTIKALADLVPAAREATDG